MIYHPSRSKDTHFFTSFLQEVSHHGHTEDCRLTGLLILLSIFFPTSWTMKFFGSVSIWFDLYVHILDQQCTLGHRHYGSVNWVSVSTLQVGIKIFTLSISVWQFYVKKLGLFLSSWQMYWRAEKLYNMCWHWGQPQPTANTVSAPNKGKKRKEKKKTPFYHSLPFEWISCLNWAHLGWSPSRDLCSSL
jgi:hypothetical protein